MSCFGKITKAGLYVIGGYVLVNMIGCLTQRAKYINEPESRTYRDVPGMTADFVKEQQAKNRARSGTSTPKLVTPSGKFAVDFKVKEGANKRFVFNVRPRNNYGDLKVHIEEWGDKYSVIGGPASFNVVFWDPTNPQSTGLAFRVEMESERGCAVREYDDSYQTIYIGKNEKISAEYNWDNTVNFAREPVDVSNATDKRTYTVTLPQLNIPVQNFIIQAHQKKPQPIEIKHMGRSR